MRKIRYTISQIASIQKRVRVHGTRARKALKVIHQLERELGKARSNYAAAKSKVEEAEQELEVIGVSTTQRGFPVDADGYVVPKNVVALPAPARRLADRTGGSTR